MLRFLNQCSRGRGAWLLMAFTALALEMVALWFQHVMLLKPCVLCIYERCALFGVRRNHRMPQTPAAAIYPTATSLESAP